MIPMLRGSARRVLAVVVACGAVMTSVSGCGGAEDEAAKPPTAAVQAEESPDTEPTPTDPAGRILVLDYGAQDDRVVLRATPAVGDRHVAECSTAVSITASTGEDLALPVPDFTLATEVIDVGEDGSLTLRSEVVDVHLKAEGMDAAQAAAALAAFEAMMGLTVTETYDQDGTLLSQTYDAPNVPDEVSDSMSSGTDANGALNWVYPIEPIGVGAVWRDTWFATDYQLSEISGDVATIIIVEAREAVPGMEGEMRTSGEIVQRIGALGPIRYEQIIEGRLLDTATETTITTSIAVLIQELDATEAD